MYIIIFIIIAIVLIYLIWNEKGLWAARIRNSIVTWASPEKGLCTDCRHCRYDDSHRFTRNDYYCSLSKCDNITNLTTMQCCEKPTINEEDLQYLFQQYDLWTTKGQSYIRSSLLGKKMGWSDVDALLTQLPVNHPEYIDQDRKRELFEQG